MDSVKCIGNKTIMLDTLISSNNDDMDNIEEEMLTTNKESSNLIDFFNNRK